LETETPELIKQSYLFGAGYATTLHSKLYDQLKQIAVEKRARVAESKNEFFVRSEYGHEINGFSEFSKKINGLKRYRNLVENNASPIDKIKPSFISREDFETSLKQVLRLYADSVGKGNWVKDEKLGKLTPEFFLQALVKGREYSPEKDKFYFQPYTQSVLGKSTDEFICYGDLHGDIHSLVQVLDSYIEDKSFKIKKEHTNKHFFFLGDLVDRGVYGTEVLYFLARLKLANPSNIHLVRGNHEDIQLNKGSGFKTELKKKLSLEEGDYQLYNLVSRFYDALPSAICVGRPENDKNKWHILCHGGLEFGDNLKPLFQSKKSVNYKLVQVDREKRKEKLKNRYSGDCLQNTDYFSSFIPCSPQKMWKKNNKEKTSFVAFAALGYLWNYYFANPNIPSKCRVDLDITYGKQLHDLLLEDYSDDKNKVNEVFRAISMMRELGNIIERIL